MQILAGNHVFPNIDIRKYMYKMNAFFKLIEDKKKTLKDTINHIRSLFDLKGDDTKFRFKILTAVNTLTYRYNIFLKYTKQLIYYIDKLIALEVIHGIDHKLIELNNMERSFLGKKSEYIANKIILEYANENSYFYDSKFTLDFCNNVIKLFNIDALGRQKIKGEIDGLIISYDGKIYRIEKIIEVKSSIKATFEDIQKFIFLQKHIRNMDFTQKIKYGKYIFNRNSFMNILNKHVSEWCIYLCMNTQSYNIVEKSHLYFSTVLKIIDDTFIKDFYIDKKDNMIKDKYELICRNRHMIDDLFETWKENIRLSNNCNIYSKQF